MKPIDIGNIVVITDQGILTMLRRYVTSLIMTVCLMLNGCSVTPEQIDDQRISEIAANRIGQVFTDQEIVDKPIDLYQAMARALKYNLDYKVEIMEEALRVSELDLAKVDMLPSLVANAGYVDRSNDSGGRSIGIVDGVESQRSSYSVERQHNVADLTLSWSVLDFGLSYVRAKQRGDDVMIAMERRRKVANRIVEDVRTAYWRAVSSEILLKQLAELDVAVDAALGKSEKLETNRTTSPMDALTYQRELMSVKLQINALHRDFAVAKQQLASLMNVPPGTDYQLTIPDKMLSARSLAVEPEQLIEWALIRRPELRELDYQLRINQRETAAALLEMIPGLRLYAGYNWDSNDLLHNENWAAWGAQINWNLVNVFRYPQHKAKVKARQELLHQQALATTMSVMTQVHISLQRYRLLNDELLANSKYLGIQNKIDAKVTASRDSGRTSQQKWIRERMNTVVAKLKHDIAYADLQNVYANIYASIGYDAFPEGFTGSESVEALSNALRDLWSKR